MSNFSEQEIEEFKTEARELLDVAERSLLAIDTGAGVQAAYDAAFRGFHNLKGAAGMMELTRLQSHTHELETILTRFKGADAIPAPYVNFFLRGIDAARQILDGHDAPFDYRVSDEAVPSAPRQPEPSFEASSQQKDEFLAECDELVERLAAALQQLEGSIEATSTDPEVIGGLYRDVHSLKGAAYLFGHANLGDVAHAIESSLENVRDGTRSPSRTLVNILFKCLKVIEFELRVIREGRGTSPTKELIQPLLGALSTAVSLLPPTVKEPVSQPPVLENAAPAPAVVPAAPIAADLPQPAAPAPAQASAPAASKDKEQEGGGTIRVPVSLLDSLMTLMGEMVLVRNQVLQFSNRSDDLEFVNLSKRLNLVTSEIQGEMMKTRMQPVGNVLSKFNRVVRDLSQELGKRIDLQLSGAETELDKSLLEAIKDPLTHIVRNSCDHGIEPIEKRREAGKPETGTIRIKASHEGGQVVIEVSDDGKGLHKDALLKKALEKGLISQSQATQLGDKEIFNLIFAPGFSTAEKITNVSGRGVGMDVVRTNIERIGGTIDLTSVAGKGTTIRLKIPLTLAIVPALIVTSENGIYAIPQVKLHELVRIDPSSEQRIEYLQGAPVYRLRGRILPLVDLRAVLKSASPRPRDPSAIVTIAVLNAEQCSFGLIVDEVQDTADIVVKPLSRVFKSLQVYSGATVLGDGSVALILDILGIAKAAQLGKSSSEGVPEVLAVDPASRASKLGLQEYLLVRAGSPTKHAIVLGYVHRIEEFLARDVELSGNQRVIRYRDAILPLVSAAKVLGYGAAVESRTESREKVSVVVIKKADTLFGIEVEEILDTLSSSAPLEASFSRNPFIFGNLNTRDELVVVMDPYEMIAAEFPDTQAIVARPGKATEPTARATVPAGSAGPLRVLLAEDTVFFRNLIVNLLTKQGHQVVSAEHGQEALEILNRDPGNFDLLISDIEMPRMSGFELAKAVRSHARHARLPMLAVSSRADRAYVSKGIDAGFDAYMEKFKPESLLAMINELVAPKGSAA